jgi:DNA-binding MarR family transcriptional regulator
MADGPSAIQREIKQRRPFPTRRQEGLVALLRTVDVVRRRLTGLLAPHGTTPQQYNVLRILRGARPDGLPTLEIAERMIEHTPGITRLIDRLERQALVRRTRHAPDRRRVMCRITPKGLRLLAGLDPVIERADVTSLGALGPDELTLLLGLLDRVRASPSGPTTAAAATEYH